MNQKTICNVAFTLHRYLGLVVGMILIIVGLTGSLLVFQAFFMYSSDWRR